MSADATRVEDTDSIISDDSTYSESNLPSAEEDDDITYDQLCTLMASWEETEIELFFFVNKWVEADEEDRKQYLDSLLERIKFCMMTLAELIQIQSSKMYLESSGTWRDIVDKTVASILSADAARALDIQSKVSDTNSIYSESNLPSADEDDDPAHISYSDLCLLMESWRESELDLFFFVKKWVEADDDNRRQHLDDLMEHIRFCLMTPEELKQMQSTKMYSEGSRACHVLVDKAIAYHKLPINIKILQDSEQSTVRGKPAATCIMNVMEFYYDGSPKALCKHLYTLDVDMGWNKAIIPPPFRFDHIVDCVVVNNFLITVSVDRQERGQFYIFDPRTLKYSEMPSAGKCMEECSLVHHKGCLYFIGGSTSLNKRSVHGIMLKYDFQTNQWSHFVNLPKLDSYKVACVFQDHIYVSDGHKVECLDPSTKTWEHKAPFLDELGPSSHLMCVMKVHGQEHLCVVTEDFKLQYYNKSTNMWSWLECAFSQELDYMGFGDGTIADGNTVLFYDDHMIGRWENGGVCLQLTYPEEGNNVVVKTLDEHFYPYPTRGEGDLSAYGVMLTVPAHKVDIPDYRIPDDDELYYSDDSDDSDGTESDDTSDE